jgi:polysaccharide pyruvyl transferase CsaB
MNGVVIFGYYGRGNLGDETNLSQLVALLKEANPRISITVISALPTETSQNLKVEAIGKFSIFKIYLAMKKAELLIGGGGSLFQDATSLRSLFYYCGLVFLAKYSKIKIFLYGQGIGPIRSKVGRIIANWSLSMVDLITVRDRLSIITLAELNIRKPEIHFTAEPLLLLNQLWAETVRLYWKKFETGKQLKVGLILRETGLIKKSFWHHLLECLSWDQNVELHLIAIDEQDLVFLQKLADGFKITLLPTRNNWELLQMAIGGLDLVLSARLHGLVAAVVQGVPCYGLATDPKIEGFCMQLGVPFQLLTAEIDCVSLCNRIMDYLIQPLENRKPWEAEISFWKARALENQLILKKYLKDGNEASGEY